jgi:glutamine amidotransferase
MKVAIINYGMGNVASVEKAVNFLGLNPIITSDPSVIRNSKFIILPGVGAFSQGMENLKKSGLIELLNNEVLVKRKPFLGICLGMQLLATKGYEPKETSGLGWIEGEVVKISDPNKSIPHLGWNELNVNNEKSLFKDFDKKDFYFIHSYHFKVSNKNDIAGTVNYGGDYVAAIQKENIFATQFHPEKSQTSGLNLLKIFFSHVKN